MTTKTTSDVDTLAQALAAALAPALTTAITAAFATTPVASAPAAAVASEPVHVGPSGKPDGRRFACTADKPCGRLLRSEKRAATHGVDNGGHLAA